MKIVNYLLLLAILAVSCKNDKVESTEQEEAQVETVIEKKDAVCISNGVPVREEPKKAGKYLSSLNLGETLVYLGISAIDSTDKNKEYYKVELSDGTVAWARSYGVLVDATPAAIVKPTAIYKRPDLVTKTDKKFQPVEFIAIVGEKDDWKEVVGAGKTKKGWINKESITTQKEDVATSTLAYKDLLSKEGEVVVENITAFLEELPYENTQFVPYLQKMLDEQVEEAIEGAIEEYETEESEIVQ